MNPQKHSPHGAFFLLQDPSTWQYEDGKIGHSREQHKIYIQETSTQGESTSSQSNISDDSDVQSNEVIKPICPDQQHEDRHPRDWQKKDYILMDSVWWKWDKLWCACVCV